MGSKKRKAKKRLLQRESNQHQEEEMCALEAIYGEYYMPHDDFQGFNLKIVPHPGQLETNLVSIVLYVRYPNEYPSKPLYLQIHDVESNSQEDLTKELLPLLNDCARHHGVNQEVCVYQLVDKCQEYLQQLNEEAIALANDASDSSEEQSLWHQMQQRDADTEAGENSQSGLEGSSCIRLSDLEGLDLSSQGLGEDLFGDDDEDDNANVLPTLTVTRASDSKALRPSNVLHKGGSKDGKAAGSAGGGRAPGGTTSAAHSPLPSPSTPAPPDVANQVAIHRKLGSPVAPEATGPTASPAPAEKSLSRTLPRVMRHLFFGDSGTGGSSNGSENSSSHSESDSEPESSEEQPARTGGMDDGGAREHAACADADPSSTTAVEKKLGVAVGGQQRVRRRRRVTGVMRDIGTEIRAGMLLGHLLVRAATMEEPGASVAGHCLALLVSHLSGLGLLPHWLGWLLGSHPDLFDPAFQRMFGQALDSGELAEAADPAAEKLLKHFWARQPSPPSTPNTHNTQQQAQQAQQQEPTMSRYRSDFEELFKLGQGGFGLVVAASNRLDGRQYAIKKIRLHTRLPRSYARIMREVATLSRLQHPNVVRYFQAWCEPLEEGADERELEEDGGEWGSSDDGSEESTSSSPRRNPRRRRKSGSSQWNRFGIDTSSLAPVQENSDEDLFAWDEASHTTAAAATTTTEEQATGHSSSSSGAVAAQMLYIQMEFCPRTLSKMIEEGNMSEEQAWGVVRGILTGLAYIHSQGVIHRDLKPANIFYDARGEVKLGDFGLAKFSPAGATPDPTAQAGDVAAAAATAALSSAAPSDKTGIIGTGYYISPEIANGWASYNEKVDLYSLGVVVYELFHTFSTAMERAVLLRELRELGRLPEEWEAKHPQQARLIRWLMQPSPAERPSAQEVLRSDLLPVRVEDEQVNDLLRSLPDHRATYLRVVDQLFAMHCVAAPAAPGSSLAPAHKQPTPAPEIALKWDVPGTPISTSGEAKALVLRTVRGVFSGLGAVEMNSSEIGCVPVNPPENAARMLTSDGEMVALRYEMRSSFARWLAAQQTLARGASTAGSGPFERGEGMQRYEIGHVHRIKRGRGLPNSYLSADLDVITPAYGKDSGTVPAEKMVADAEVIKATCQILESLPELGGYEVRLGHRQLLEVSVSSLGLSKEVKQLVLSQLRAASAVSPNQPAAREASWPNIRTSLDDLGVPVEAALRCRQLLLNLPGVAEDVMQKSRSYLSGLSLTKAVAVQLETALDELEALISHLRTLGLARQAILLDPLLKPDADYFKGAIFQVHILPASGGCSLMMATGGRYDSLLQRLWPAACLPSPGAVGVTLNVERLCLLLGKQLSNTPGNAACPPCQLDVVVGSRGGGSGLLSQRLALVGKLRAAGVKAELLRRSCPSFTEQYELATNRAAKWLIILESSRLEAAGMVKVKHVDKRGAEEEWPLCDVVKNIKLLQTTSGSGRHSQSHLMPSQHLPVTPDADLAEPIVGSLEKRHDSWVARRKGHFK